MDTYKQTLKRHLEGLINCISEELTDEQLSILMKDFYVDFESLTPHGCEQALKVILSVLRGNVNIDTEKG